MDKTDLQRAFDALAARRVPEVPANLEQNVWREIRKRRTAPESIWDAFTAMFRRPVWALSATMVAVVISVSFGAFENDSSRFGAHSSLNLGVFSANAPSLPSTLLAHAP